MRLSRFLFLIVLLALPGLYQCAATSKAPSEQSDAAKSFDTVELNVEAGKLYFVKQIDKIGLNDLRVHLQVVDEAPGKKAVPSLKLLVSSYVPED